MHCRRPEGAFPPVVRRGFCEVVGFSVEVSPDRVELYGVVGHNMRCSAVASVCGADLGAFGELIGG